MITVALKYTTLYIRDNTGIVRSMRVPQMHATLHKSMMCVRWDKMIIDEFAVNWKILE